MSRSRQNGHRSSPARTPAPPGHRRPPTTQTLLYTACPSTSVTLPSLPILCSRGLVGAAALVGVLGGAVIVHAGSRIANSQRGRALWSRQLRGLYVRRRPPPRDRCLKCGGFGIVRCRLCRGAGIVGYEKKLQHRDPCPLCTAKRYTNCELCNGSGWRKHVRRHQPALSGMDWRRPASVVAGLNALREELQTNSLGGVFADERGGLLNRLFGIASRFTNEFCRAARSRLGVVSQRVDAAIAEQQATRQQARMGRVMRARLAIERNLQQNQDQSADVVGAVLHFWLWQCARNLGEPGYHSEEAVHSDHRPRWRADELPGERDALSF